MPRGAATSQGPPGGDFNVEAFQGYFQGVPEALFCPLTAAVSAGHHRACGVTCPNRRQAITWHAGSRALSVVRPSPRTQGHVPCPSAGHHKECRVMCPARQQAITGHAGHVSCPSDLSLLEKSVQAWNAGFCEDFVSGTMSCHLISRSLRRQVMWKWLSCLACLL